MMTVTGFTFRPATSTDIHTAVEIVAAEEAWLGRETTTGLDELSDWWRLFDLESGTWIVDSDEGRAAAFAGLIQRGSDADYWVVVHPEFTGRGLGTALLERAEAEARARAATKLTAGMVAENDAARRLFEQRGFREGRHYYRMQIDLDGSPAVAEWPDGATVELFRRDDARAFHGVLHEAFEGDPGFHGMPFDEWERYRLDAPEADTSLWFVARADREIAGVIRCDARRWGGGFVGALGVRKPWRSRGLGRALLLHAFAEFRRRGEPHVSLGVDAENPTGATRLYERAGMRVVTEDVVFEKKLA